MNRKERKSKKIFIPIVIFIISIFLTLFVWSVIRRDLSNQLSLQFNDQSQQITSLIDQRINFYANVVYGAQGLFAASHSVEANEWAAYIHELNIPLNYPGISSMIYIERVPASATSTYPYTIYPYSATKTDYYPLTYTASTTSAVATSTVSSALGFDASSDPVRWQAMSDSVTNDMPTASGIVPTVVSRVPSFGVYGPIYRNGDPIDTLAERLTALVGFVYVPFRVDTLFKDLTSSPIFDKNIDVEVYDAPTLAEASTSNFVYDSSTSTLSAFSASNPGYKALSQVTHLSIDGRTWTLFFSPLPSYSLYGLESSLPDLSLIIGILLSVLLSIAVYSYASSLEKGGIMRAKARDDAILAGIGDAVFAIDTDKKIILYNKEAAALSGYSIEEALGKEYREIFKFTTEGSTVIQDDFILAALGGTKAAMQAHMIIHHRNGTVIPVADSASPFMDASGAVEGVVVVFRDVSQERSIDQAKSDFVSITSHQLKTPIAQLKGYIANMLDGLTGDLNPKQKDYLGDMLKVADSNSTLIDDLLNVSRIERGIIKFDPAQVDLIDLAKRATAPLHEVSAAKKVSLTETYPDKPVSVWADQNKSVEAIRNIIDNAIKFSPEGKTVAVTVAAGDVPTITISDQGAGIDPDVQKELFEKNRIWSGKVKASGAGLGLYLSKHFVELQGGKISYVSVPSKGTTFSIEFKTHA